MPACFRLFFRPANQISWLLLIAGALLAACSADFGVDGRQFTCQSDGDCGAGWQCIEGACYEEGKGPQDIPDGSVGANCTFNNDCESNNCIEGRCAPAASVEDAGPAESGPQDACKPNCAGKNCGPDGCGGQCGQCKAGEACASGVCKTSCQPSCEGKKCGDDGCGGSCGTCADGEACESGACKCMPKCARPECGAGGCKCGPDGCGGQCGICPGKSECKAATGQCEEIRQRDCTNRECGDDGVGGSCGTCSAGLECNSNGKCVPPPCQPDEPGFGIPSKGNGPLPGFSVRFGLPVRALTGLDAAGRYPESKTPVLFSGNTVEAFLSVDGSVYRFEGKDLITARVSPILSVLRPGAGADPDKDRVLPIHVRGGGAARILFYDGATNRDNASLKANQFLYSFMRAVSADGGVNFSNRIHVVTTEGTPDFKNPAQPSHFGAGTGTIHETDRYLFLYYVDFDAPRPGIYAARACVSSGGDRGAWRKYIGGGFKAAAVKENAYTPSEPGDPLVVFGAGEREWNPILSENSYLGVYTLITGDDKGLWMRVSRDAINWGARERIMEHWPAEDHTIRIANASLYHPENYQHHTLARNARLLVSASADGFMQPIPGARPWLMDMELVAFGEQPVSLPQITLTQYKNAATGELWPATATSIADHSTDLVLGRIHQGPALNTAVLYDCLRYGADHFPSRKSNCELEGARVRGVLGYIYPEPSRGGLIPVYRCYLELPGDARDHFLSLTECNGENGRKPDKLLGYIDLAAP
ncbi:MAG: hypothetical protein GMKNLPBB_00345 [Myxococcota bacterium]|nr:hypothetical protein [Myxococcota bacterium]